MKYRAKRTYRKRRGTTRRKTYKKTYRKKRVYRKRKPRRRSYRRPYPYSLRDFPREDEMTGGPVRKYQIVKPAYERTAQQKEETRENKAAMLDELVHSPEGANRGRVRFKEPQMSLPDVLQKFGSRKSMRAVEGWGKLGKKLLNRGYLLPALPAAAATATGFASGLGNAFNMGLGRAAALGAMRAMPMLL